MEFLFTPWRYKYVSNVDDKKDCIFCKANNGDNDRESLIVSRGTHCFVILNLYPYSTGHMMIAPYDHQRSIEDLDDQTLSEMMSMSKKCIGVLRKTFDPEGFNIGINIERVAGAGITSHVHLHVVPRWAGDSNFMPVCGETRILPLSLEEVWSKVKENL